MKPLFKWDSLLPRDDSNDLTLRMVPDLEEMIRQQANIVFQTEEAWFVEQVIAVLKTKGYTVTKEDANE